LDYTDIRLPKFSAMHTYSPRAISSEGFLPEDEKERAKERL
jgi:hypothetical protein